MLDIIPKFKYVVYSTLIILGFITLMILIASNPTVAAIVVLLLIVILIALMIWVLAKVLQRIKED